MGFIEEIAGYVQEIAPEFGIKVCSPIIGQAILESASGTSELSVNAHNYFGIKHRAGRCPSACGTYVKVGSEQNADGSYVSSTMLWSKWADMKTGVRGYFEFINVSNYANLKGVTDPKTYLENIKKDGYATSLKYVQNIISVIEKYNLTKYDPVGKEEKKMILNVHGGHSKSGARYCGAVGILNESVEDRRVKDLVIAKLRALGHTVYDCTVDNGTSQSDVLKKIVDKANAHTVDLDISIHFNSASSKNANGTEVLVYTPTGKAVPYAKGIVDNIAALGFTNRGVKTSKTLYFLRKTKSPSLLIECCFVSSEKDAKLYSADKMADAIVNGIVGQTVTTSTTSTTTSKSLQSQNNSPVTASGYDLVFDAKFYADKYDDLKATYGYDRNKLFTHYLSYGRFEGRQANATFNPAVYKARYADLQKAFGNSWELYVKHYIEHGFSEKRTAI